jgi:hypothetical protein
MSTRAASRPIREVKFDLREFQKDIDGTMPSWAFSIARGFFIPVSRPPSRTSAGPAISTSAPVGGAMDGLALSHGLLVMTSALPASKRFIGPKLEFTADAMVAVTARMPVKCGEEKPGWTAFRSRPDRSTFNS